MTSSSFHYPHCWEYHLGDYLTQGERTSFQCLEPPTASVAPLSFNHGLKPCVGLPRFVWADVAAVTPSSLPFVPWRQNHTSELLCLLFPCILHFKKILSLLNLLQYCFYVLVFWFFFFFGQEACRILALPRPMEPPPPALEGEVLITGPPGKSSAVPFMGTLHGCALWSPQSISPRALSPWSLPGPH